jgi:hypothetical protein
MLPKLSEPRNAPLNSEELVRRLQEGRARAGAAQKLGWHVGGSAPNDRRLEACCWGAKVDGGIIETVP